MFKTLSCQRWINIPLQKQNIIRDPTDSHTHSHEFYLPYTHPTLTGSHVLADTGWHRQTGDRSRLVFLWPGGRMWYSGQAPAPWERLSGGTAQGAEGVDSDATSPLCQRDLQLVILRLEVSVRWTCVGGLFVVRPIDAGCLSGRQGFTPRFLAKVNYLHMLLLVLTLAAN